MVLPYALERAPRYEWPDLPAFTLEGQVLKPLTDFGLLESDRAPAQYSQLEGGEPRKDLRYRITPLYGKPIRFEL